MEGTKEIVESIETDIKDIMNSFLDHDDDCDKKELLGDCGCNPPYEDGNCDTPMNTYNKLFEVMKKFKELKQSLKTEQ